ncbi:MAG: HNH endonuclease [Microcoleus sp. SIO2G3]|nr:HNH endonuclease [Microcoleus sp. SIO2G3]
MTDSPFEELVKSLFEATKRTDIALAELRAIATKINAKYQPRAQFNCWRDSEEGKLWKQKQYQAQRGCCDECGEPILLKGSHIDHILPLSHFPHLAVDTQNLRITCPDCNIAKSNKITVPA